MKNKSEILRKRPTSSTFISTMVKLCNGPTKKGAIPKCKSCCVIGPLTCVNGTDLLIERTTKDVSPRKMRELRFYGNGRKMPQFTDPFRSAGRNHLGQIYNVGFVVVVAVLSLNLCENCS